MEQFIGEIASCSTLREECRLRVFENRILIRIFGRDKNGDWRRLHNEELHSLYRSPNKVWVIKSRSQMEEGRSRPTFKILTGKPTGKRPLDVDGGIILE